MSLSSDQIRAAWDRVTIVTVTHNGGLVLAGFLDALPDHADLIVVDNASTDDSLDIIAAKRPQTTIVRNAIGLGYGNGANRGLAIAKREFVLLANPDSILSDDAVAKLVAVADRFPDAGMVGPNHLNPDGSVEISYDVSLWQRKKFGKRVNEVLPSGPVCVDFLSGAVNMVRMSILRDVGFYDREIFLYYEDDDMCLRLRAAGASLIFVPDAHITHIGGGSVRPNRYYYWEKFWHIAWSMLYIEQKYKGRNAALILIARHLPELLLKSLGYALVLKRDKSWRDLAKAAGHWGFLTGKRASKMPITDNPEPSQP